MRRSSPNRLSCKFSHKSIAKTSVQRSAKDESLLCHPLMHAIYTSRVQSAISVRPQKTRNPRCACQLAMPNINTHGRKINLRESDPNPCITFISALPDKKSRISIPSSSSSSSSSATRPIPTQDQALQLLRSLAAQVSKPMKTRRLLINSLEEYPFNTVFAGRNWNHGEVVELVLRRKDGRFFPREYLLSVLCHEVGHVHHSESCFHELFILVTPSL